jgi:hypothetical protein
MSNPITGVDGLRTARCLGAQIRSPGLAACAGRLRQCLAMSIRSFQTAQVGALARPIAGYKKRHIRRLRRLLLRLGIRAKPENRDCRESKTNRGRLGFHCRISSSWER